MKTKMTKWISLGTSILFNQRGNFMGAEGGEGGSAGDGGEGGTSNDGGGGVDWQYPEGFDESLKGNATLMKFADKEKGTFNYANMMKSLVHAQSVIGKDKVALPDETWTDDQWNELYQKLGKPESLETYEIKGQLPEGMEENKEFAQHFKDMAFKANLLPGQANQMYSAINEFINNSLTTANEAEQAEYNAAVDKLKSDWGEAYEQKCTTAYKALETFASNEEINALKQGGFLQDPVVTRLFDKIADSLKGDNFDFQGETKTFGLTPAEAEEEISKMYNPQHPFMIKGHPQRAYYQEKMQKLQRLKLAGKQKR